MTPSSRFDKEAAAWDSNPTRLKLAADVAGAMMKAVAFGHGMDVLDFGCGTGLITLALAPKVRSITGADTSPGMLGVMQAKAEHQGLANVRPLLLQPAESAPGPFDAIVSSMTLHHVERIDALLAPFCAALKPGGHLLVADLDPDGGEFHPDGEGVFHPGFDRSVLKEALLRAGFTKVTDTTAAEVTKPSRSGAMRTFTVFLVAGTKKLRTPGMRSG